MRRMSRARTSMRHRRKSAVRWRAPRSTRYWCSAALVLDHLWKKAHDQAERAEVIELHRPLEIVKAIERVDDSATDRTSRIVDQIIAGSVILEDSGDHCIAGRELRHIAGVDPRLAACGFDLLLGFDQLVHFACDQQHLRACRDELESRCSADARRSAGNDHGSVRDASREASIDEQVWVGIALPIVPDARRITFKRGHGYAGALEPWPLRDCRSASANSRTRTRLSESQDP